MIIESKTTVTDIHITADEWEIFGHYPDMDKDREKGPLYPRGHEQRIEIASLMTNMLKNAINDDANGGNPSLIQAAWEKLVQSAGLSKYGALDTEPRGRAWMAIEKVFGTDERY